MDAARNPHPSKWGLLTVRGKRVLVTSSITGMNKVICTVHDNMINEKNYRATNKNFYINFFFTKMTPQQNND